MLRLGTREASGDIKIERMCSHNNVYGDMFLCLFRGYVLVLIGDYASVADRCCGNPPHPATKWSGSWIGHGAGNPPTPPPSYVLKWIKPPENLKKAAARHQPQPHQVVHQPSKGEPQWACTYKRWAHNKAN